MFVLLQRLTQNSFYIVTIIANMLRTDYILKLKLMLAIVSAVLCVRSLIDFTKFDYRVGVLQPH